MSKVKDYPFDLIVCFGSNDKKVPEFGFLDQAS